MFLSHLSHLLTVTSAARQLLVCKVELADEKDFYFGSLHKHGK